MALSPEQQALLNDAPPEPTPAPPPIATGQLNPGAKMDDAYQYITPSGVVAHPVATNLSPEQKALLADAPPEAPTSYLPPTAFPESKGPAPIVYPGNTLGSRLGAFLFGKYGIPTYADGLHEGFMDRVTAAPGAIWDTAKQAYNDTPNPLTPAGLKLLHQDDIVSSAANSATGAVVGAFNAGGAALTQAIPYQIGNIAGGSRLGQDLAAATASGLTASAMGKGMGADPELPSAPRVSGLSPHPTLPGVALTPDMVTGASKGDIALGAALRADPRTAATLAAADDLTHRGLMANLTGKLSTPELQTAVAEVDHKGPSGVLGPDGKLDAAKFNNWRADLNSPSTDQHLGPGYNLSPADLQKVDAIGDHLSTAKANSAVRPASLASTGTGLVDRYLAGNADNLLPYAMGQGMTLGGNLLAGVAPDLAHMGLGHGIMAGAQMLNYGAKHVLGPGARARVAFNNDQAVNALGSAFTRLSPPPGYH